MHDINFAMKYSDYICAMKEGHIVAFGKNKDVINKQLLSTIYATNIDYLNR